SVILFVGRLARRKGVKEFIQNCLPLIVRKIPQACFVIAGGNPTDSLTHRDDVLSELQEAALHLGLGDHTRFVGEVSENALVKLYQCCDVMVLPALASAEDVEGFGLVLLEAAAAGKPVVATRVGGIPDAVEDGITGLLVEEGEYFNLAEAVIKYLNDDELSRQAGEKGQKRARRQFGWETVTARYEELFLKLLI
ncbi:MAG: glycosyltransferase family 4 protein, partial [Deltaproteobacteria bacterium]|nr:glycosyltransferase family 4 protein [Deltaproteobacteria bacterium]